MKKKRLNVILMSIINLQFFSLFLEVSEFVQPIATQCIAIQYIARTI